MVRGDLTLKHSNAVCSYARVITRSGATPHLHEQFLSIDFETELWWRAESFSPEAAARY